MKIILLIYKWLKIFKHVKLLKFSEKKINLILYLFRETGNWNEGKISKKQFKKILIRKVFNNSEHY